MCSKTLKAGNDLENLLLQLECFVTVVIILPQPEKWIEKKATKYI